MTILFDQSLTVCADYRAAENHLESLLSKCWSRKEKLYLFSPGGWSEADYLGLVQGASGRIIAIRSIFRWWLRPISFVFRGSFIATLELNEHSGWSKALVDMSKHGYVLLIFGDAGETEEILKNGVVSYSIRNGLRPLFAKLSGKSKTILINGENPKQIEFESKG